MGRLRNWVCMPIELNSNAVALGRGALRALNRSLMQDLGDQAPQRLQEAGHAGGADFYACFQRWLRERTGLDDPGAMDAAAFGPVMGDFFEALGWGRVTIERLGRGSLAVDATEWAEADPGMRSEFPSCFLSAGLLADFMAHLANCAVSVIEVECRSCDHARCRFLLGTQQVVDAVYDAIAQGQDYRSALAAR